MRATRIAGLAAMALVCQIGILHAETLEEIEKATAANWEKISSMTYDMSMKTDMAGQGFSMKSDSTGKSAMVHKADKWLMKMDMKSSSEQVVAGNATKSDSTTSMVCDGDFIYTVMDYAGTKMATKAKADTWAKMAGGKGFFSGIKDVNELKVLPDEQVDGAAAFVVEAKAKGAPEATPMKYYFSKDNGMVIQTVTTGPDGKVTAQMKITNVKIGASVADGEFVFKAPEGVQIQDMTQK